MCCVGKWRDCPNCCRGNAGTGTGGAAVGATNGPVSIVVAASSATAGSAKTISQPQTVWNSVSGSGSGTATVCTASATADTVSLTWTESTQNNIRVRACTSNTDTSQTDNANVVLSTPASSSSAAAAAGGNSTATGSASSAASTSSSKVTQVYTFASLTANAYTGNTKGNIECAYTCTVENAVTCSWCVAKTTSPYRDYKNGISITSSVARRSAKVTFVMSVANSIKSLSELKTLVASNSNAANFAAALTKVNNARYSGGGCSFIFKQQWLYPAALHACLGVSSVAFCQNYVSIIIPRHADLGTTSLSIAISSSAVCE